MPYPLIPRANAEGWRAFLARRHQEAFRKNAPKIWQRDQYRCQFCGFQSKRYQEIVNVDGNYRNNVATNLTTACGLCAHTLFMGAQGLGHKVIFCPQMTQVQISQIVRVLFCATDSASELSETAKALYRNMIKWAEPIEEIFGKGASEFETFGQSVLDTPGITDDQYAEVMKYVRVLPNPKVFTEQIQYWSKSVMPHLLSNDPIIMKGKKNA